MHSPRGRRGSDGTMFEPLPPADAHDLEAGGGDDAVEPAKLVDVVPGLRDGGDVDDLGDPGVNAPAPVVRGQEVAVEVGARCLADLPDVLVPGMRIDVPPVHVRVDDGATPRNHQ